MFGTTIPTHFMYVYVPLIYSGDYANALFHYEKGISNALGVSTQLLFFAHVYDVCMCVGSVVTLLFVHVQWRTVSFVIPRLSDLD